MIALNKKTALAFGATSMIASSAYALTSTFTIAINFVDPFSLTEATAMSFGNLLANQAATYTLDTADAVTASAGGAVVGGTPASADITVADSGSSATTLNVQVVNLTASNGVTPSLPFCNYDGGGATACGAAAVTGLTNPGTGTKTLIVGLTLTADGTQADASAATPSYDVTVAYD